MPLAGPTGGLASGVWCPAIYPMPELDHSEKEAGATAVSDYPGPAELISYLPRLVGA